MFWIFFAADALAEAAAAMAELVFTGLVDPLRSPKKG